MNPWSKTIPNTITTWTQPESIAINTWSQSESDTVIPWPQPESVAINPWTQSIADTVTQWIQEESAEIIPWTKIVSDQILPWTQTETPVNHWLQSEMDKLYQTSLSLGPSPTEPLWIETLSGTDTQWSQADSLVVISQTQILTDTVTLYMQAETPSFHSRTMSETDTVTTWTSAESLAVSSLKECETESVSTWVKKGYPNVNFWTQPENDTVTSWAQVETPGINSFTHSVVDMVPPWTQSESSVVNLWTQYVVDVDTLWMQTGSPAVNPWTKSVSDGGVQWTQNEREAVSQWTQTASDKVISFAQAEFPIVESLTNTVTDIVTPWTEVESSAVNPGTEVTADAVTPSNQPIYPSVTPWATRETDILWTHANSDIINLFTETVFHTLILWTQGVILNPWAQLETDIVTPWTQPESPPISSWAWSKTNPVTSWSENKYAVLNPWTQIEANTFAPWSQPEFGAVNSWIHLENDIVTTFIQGESQVLNHSPMVVADAMRAWTQVDSTTVNPGMQADNDKVTLWTKSESLATYHLPISVTDTVTVWNMAAIISVKSWPHSVTETGTQWTQNESPLVYPLTQSIMNSVTLITHTINLAIIPGMNLSATAVKPWTQVESAKENGWTVSETGIPWTMESSPIIKHMMETLSNTNITRIKSEFSEIKIWTSPGARTDPLWTQAESPTVNPWTQSQVHIVTKWTHIDPPTNILTQAKFAAINMWTQSELPTIITFTESRLPAIYPSIQIEGTVTSSMRAEFLAINPWTEITATTVTLWIQAEYPIVNPWTVSENDTAKRGIVAESPSSFLTKSEQHRKPLWTQTESPINPMMQDIANIFTMWTKTESLALNPWTKNIEDTFTVQTLNKSPTENYWTDTLASTLWTHYESPTLNPWTQAVTSTFTQWNQVESPTVNSQEETLVSTFAPWIQFESPRVNSQPGNIVSTMAWLNQDESPITIPCTEAVISRVTLWIQESAVGNSCPQTIASITTLHTEIPWSDIIDATVTTWNKTESLADKVASIVTIWSQDESPAVNPRTYNLVSTDAPWNKVKYVTINYWTLDPSSTVIPWIQTEFPALKIWTQTLFSTILSWTQDEFPANSLTDTVVSIVIPWNHAVSPKIKTWTETLASTLSPWIHTMSPRVDTWAETVSTVTSWTQSLSSAYPLTVIVSSTVTCWTHSEFPGVNSCTDNVIDGIIFWTLLKTESKKEWTLPEASIFTISLHPPVDSTEPLIQIEKPSLLGIYPEISNIQTLPVSEMFISWIVPFTQAAILLPKPEVDVSRYWFKTQTERMKHWTQSEYQTVSTLTQFVAERVDSITQYETDPLTSWIQTKTGISHPWSQFERNTMRTSFFSDSDAVRPLIQTDPGILTPWIHYSNSIVTSWTRVDSNAVSLQTQTEVNTVTQLTQADMSAVKHLTMTVINNAIPWFQNQPDTIRPRTQLESQIITNLVRLEYQFDHSWVQPDAKAIRPLAYFEIHETKPWPQSESQVVSNLTEVDTATFWAPIQNDAIGPWSQTETQMTCSVIPNEVGKISPHIQPETSLITSWTDIQSSKVQPCIPLETAITRPWAQYETVEINPSIQLEADAALRPWLQTQMNSVFSEFDTLISCLQTQGATTRPWIQQSVSPWTQTEVGIILSCTQQRALTDQAWIHPESQEIKSWIKLEADTVKSWLHSQMNKVGPWVYSKSQVVSAPVQPEEGVIHPWIHSEFQADQPWTHSETDFIASAALPKSDSVSVRIKPEIQIRNNTHYEGGIITLFGSWSKSVPFLPKETVSLPDEYFTTMSTEIAATESQPKLQYFHSSEFTNSFLLTLPSLWLPERVDYLNHGSKLQITKTEGSSYMATTSPSLLSPSLSFLTPFSLQSSYTFSPSCSIFSCTFSSSGISQSCSIHSSMAFFSPTLLPLASSVSFVQELNSSKFSEETILSHTVSSLFAAPATLLTKQPSLIHGSQYETNSNHHEQDPLKYSEFNVSLAECHLGVVWKESFQAFWLFKTAIISHETTECGLRPGLIPHCPNCWEAEVGEFPWMVSIQLSFSHFCAGSILNEQWILTTARCANFIKNSEALALVQVGLIDLQDSAQAQTVGIHRAMPYLGPKGPLGPGLLFLKQPLHFQPLVLPICLVESMEQDENIQLYDCWLPSWSLMRGSPGILQKRHLSILQVSTCAQFWPKLNEFTFCVEAKKAMGEAGCKGDLGAPLVCHLQQKDTWVQVGILSHFDEHCTKPYVFSQVSPFLFWLQGVTRPSHAPWSQQGPMTTSASISLSVSASTNASAFTSTPASIRPHFISLPQPQTLADRISLRYAMPWQVMIISCGNQICSGSIVSRSWVLTAAHCVRHMNPEDTAVILGLRHPGTPLRVVKVSTILLHERFRLVSGTARNDLALLLLQEVQTPIQILAPLGNLKNLNTSECWLAGPRILKQGETDENPEVLQMQVMGASSCAHLYPDIGSSIICFVTQAKSSSTNVEPVIPGSAVMCRPTSGNGSWRQIGLTSLKALATIVSPHFSWILSTSAKAGHPLNQAVIPWLEKPKSSGCLTQSTSLLLLSIIVIAVFCDLVVIAK
ncbi:uncharacterized protein LOC119250672 [Talpa occidentalis]|uniref:uncharacterized protein LOC119250672 n=1 Tax=Talpa occidentalis TaxID=50954 RepID=UPI00189046EF|nr:uncharacterized protein LOC119250672 [Talpa occidentalis]